MNNQQRFECPNVSRYFDLMQNLVHFEMNAEKQALPTSFLQMDLNAPADPKPVKPVAEKKAKKGKENDGKATEQTKEKTAEKTAEKTKEVKQEAPANKDKAAKKEPKEKKAAAPKPPAAAPGEFS